MKKLLAALLFFVSAVTCAEIVTIPIPGAPGLNVTVGTGVNALPLQDIRTNPNAVNISTSDDGWNNVPLGFNFPFYGRTFTNSWAMTNGVVTFQDPQTSGAYGLCCSGVDLSRTTDARYNWSIYGLHTDLYSHSGQNQYYLRDGNSMTYGWYNVSQCCSNQGGNSFEIKINSAGLVDTRIAGALVQYNAVTSGMAGDLSQGQYYQYYHGQGLNITPGSASIFSWQALGGTGADACLANPLLSPSCPGYAAAYLTQQCTISALYNSSCPGYAQAYYQQQCSANPLYDVNCPGYATAYLDYRCSLDPLYSTTCSGYERAYHDQQCSINPLYARDCTGYATAYHDQQCSISPLYATDCPGYGAAYLTQQCNISQLYSTQCPNYAQAYKAQQCSLNALYATDCPGYAVAYKAQQCSLNALYATDCPGYQQAYYNQQCGLNALYDKGCPGYAEAYALKYIVVTSPTTTPTTTTTTTTTATTTPTTDSSGKIAVAVVADPVVNQVITTTATSASPAQSATATVPLVQAPAPAPVAAAATTAKEEKKDAPSSSVSSTTTAQTTTTEAKPAAPTARQELQAKREAAAKAKAIEEGKNLANKMGDAANMEQQKQVQNVVIQAMGFTPGFDAYGKVMIPDTVGYRPFTVYNNQKNVDNRRLGLGLYGPSDRLHNELVDSQYKGD